jgi:hypothetical protein
MIVTHRPLLSFVALAAAMVLAGGLGLVPAAAYASCVTLSPGPALPPGAALSLTCQTVNGGPSSNASSGTINLPAVPGSYYYGNGFAGTTSPIPGSQPSSSAPPSWPAAGFGFYDDWVFSIAEGTLNSLTSTIDLGSLQVSDLQVRLYSLVTNALPTLQAPVGGAINAWSAPISGGPGLNGSYSVIPTTSLGAGTYVLEVRGNVTGGNGGSYSGTLNLAPIPLPAAAWLLLSGLAALGSLARRRS